MDVSVSTGMMSKFSGIDVWLASAALESVTVTVKLSVFADVGVPLTAPPVAIDRPSLDAEVRLHVQVTGAVPPVAVNAKL
jgi:hypothetical protein